ncbi:MAG: DNA internalization-related competence protein ComEC/Rec2 [Methylotenera sp.]|nr:DNA internalization-related competence protein ComEC/Rec2 [Methylotenera sp.]
MILAALMFVLGAWVVQHMAQLPSMVWLVCASLAAIMIFITQAYPRFFRYFQLPKFLKIGLFSIAAFLFGVCWASGFAVWRMSDELPHAWEQKTIAIEGVVASLPEATERGERFRFDVEKILTKDAIVPRHISLNLYRANQYGGNNESEEDSTQFSQFHAGERWLLSVRLKRPHSTINPHGFDFESWALSENIRATGSIKSKAGMKKLDNFVWRPSYIIEHLRENTQQRIARVLADKPYSGVIQALVMGEDSQISVDDWQVFLRTGTTHLMSISGLHITMLSGLAFGLMSFVWRRMPTLATRLPTRKAAVLAGAITALAYALIAGFSVPTQRTFYMLMVFAVALWSGRQLVITQVLAIALLIVVLFDPWAVNAPGFWLSFGAVAMLAYALSGRIGQVHWLKTALQTQWAVTIGMLPLLLIMFNQTSIISPIANAFAIPLISFVVTPLALLGSFLTIDWMLHLSHKALEVCMFVLNWLNQLPMAIWQQHSPPTWTLFPALFGVLWILLPRGFPMRWLGLLGFLPMLLIVPVRPALGDMKVTVLDVGQGLSVVVQTAKHSLLYDAGPKFNAQSDAGNRIIVPFLRGEGVSKIDGFVVSHDDNDHSGGMVSVLALIPVSWLASSLPADADIPVTQKKMPCFAGQAWTWDGVQFEVLHPDFESYDDATLKDNYRSCVLKVTSQSGSVLITGDIEKEAEHDLLSLDAEILKSDVMIVPHHGSKTSSTTDFIEAVSPSISIFTPGYLNRYKHPRPEVIERYRAANSLLYRSDYNGAIEMRFINHSQVSQDKVTQSKIHLLSWRNQYKRYWQDTF